MKKIVIGLLLALIYLFCWENVRGQILVSSEVYLYKGLRSPLRQIALVEISKDFKSGNAGLWSYLYYEGQEKSTYAEGTGGIFKRWDFSPKTFIECGLGLSAKSTPKFFQVAGYFYSETKPNPEKEKGKVTSMLMIERGVFDKDFWYRGSILYNVNEKLCMGIFSDYSLVTGLRIEYSLRKFTFFETLGYEIQEKNFGAFIGLRYEL